MSDRAENEADAATEDGEADQDVDDAGDRGDPRMDGEESIDGEDPDDPEPVKENDEESTEEVSDDPFAALPRPDLSTLRIRMFNVSCVFYVVMGLVGVFWMNSQGIVHTRLSTNAINVHLTASLVMGAAVAGAVFLLGAILRRTSDWAIMFEEEFAPLVNVFSYMQVPVMALVSAAGEELFFRGALQEALGLWLAALIFGLIHIPWKKTMLPWPVFALVLGLLFGYIVDLTGSLYGPFLGHFLINLVNITLIKRRHPMDENEIIDELMSR